MSNLSPDHQRFVDEFLKDGNASAAAQRAGLSARRGASLKADPAIAREIASRRAAEAPAAIPSDIEPRSVEAQIAEADRAYGIAEAERSSAGMVAASTLKSKLLGYIAGGTAAAADEADAAPVAPRDMARAMLSALREFQEILGVNFILVPPGHRAIAIPDGETVLRVKDPAIASIFREQYGDALALEDGLDVIPLPRVSLENTEAPDPSHPSHARLGSNRHAREIPGERDVLASGYSIAFDAYEAGGQLRSRWVIRAPEGHTVAERLTREEAIAAADELAGMRQ